MIKSVARALAVTGTAGRMMRSVARTLAVIAPWEALSVEAKWVFGGVYGLAWATCAVTVKTAAAARAIRTVRVKVFMVASFLEWMTPYTARLGRCTDSVCNG
jgi:hypothetical protein